jgi:enhancing lycopene biosynthesis protein 2
VVLNTLRATRVSTDAMALAMALHTGGIGVQDFVIAPAMLSMTTLLAESAIGRYMNRAQEQLKLRQRVAVEQLFTEHLTIPLSRMTELLDPATRLNISPEVLAEAEHLRNAS